MTEEERNKYFWMQYHGEVKAIDLPQEYKEWDKRVYCCNEDCCVRNKCLFFNRYMRYCDSAYSRLDMRSCIKDEKGRWKRNAWERRSNDVNYMMASFGFCAAQRGTVPCEHYKFGSKDDL